MKNEKCTLYDLDFGEKTENVTYEIETLLTRNMERKLTNEEKEIFIW
jgi:hypothetical protein